MAKLLDCVLIIRRLPAPEVDEGGGITNHDDTGDGALFAAANDGAMQSDALHEQMLGLAEQLEQAEKISTERSAEIHRAAAIVRRLRRRVQAYPEDDHDMTPQALRQKNMLLVAEMRKGNQLSNLKVAERRARNDAMALKEELLVVTRSYCRAVRAHH